MHCNCRNQKLFDEVLCKLSSGLQAHWVDETSSTNDDVKTKIRAAEENVAVALVADRQTAGRGTRGRRWESADVSVLLSVGVALPEGTKNVSGLSLVAGAACVEALRATNAAVRLKWPNDIWIRDGKAAGILCEIVRNKKQSMHAVVGIGVNICLDDAEIAATDAPAAALLNRPVSEDDAERLRIEVAAALGAAVEKACANFGAASLCALQARWPQLDAFSGRKVLLTSPAGQYLEGTVAGIGACGELLFADASGQVRAYTDARIRPLAKEKGKQ